MQELLKLQAAPNESSDGYSVKEETSEDGSQQGERDSLIDTDVILTEQVDPTILG